MRKYITQNSIYHKFNLKNRLESPEESLKLDIEFQRLLVEFFFLLLSYLIPYFCVYFAQSFLDDWK